MDKDAPCSSKTKLYSSSDKDKKIPPLRIKRSNIKRHSPSPRPRFKCRDPPPVNPIADQVSEKDFQDLQKYKDIPTDPDTIKNYLQNNLSREKLLPRTQRGKRQFITQHIPDNIYDLLHPNATEDANRNNDEIMQKDCVDDEKVVEEMPTEMPSLSTKEVDKNVLKEKIKITSSSVLSSASRETDSPEAKKRRIEMVDSSQPETLENSVTSSPLIEVQNNLDRDSLSRSQSICSGLETSNDQENSTMDPNDSPTPRSKKRKSQTWGKKRGKRAKAKVDTAQEDTESQEKKPERPPYWFLVSILVRRMLTKAMGKKWTFLSAYDRSKLSANPKTGLLDHPFRIPGRPEPFSKESASYC
uniref:Centromere protein C n=1 Tax=Panagrolaimus sp. PS1159 TaxID=55785 RepID=A0AC35GR64_9BILA